MMIAVERRLENISGRFFDALADTLTSLEHEVIRPPIGSLPKDSNINFVWNRHHGESRGLSIVCELGWLPRTAYQMSWGGINGDSHIAPYVWDGTPPTAPTRERVAAHRRTLKSTKHHDFAYMATGLAPVTGLPEAFLLVPLQMSWDVNILRCAPPPFSDLQLLIDYLSWHNPDLPLLFKQHPADVSRGNQQLALKTCRHQDRILAHDDGNVHQLLRNDGCVGVIALNSNALHDALLWDKPGAALADNIWPRGGPSPFLHHVPRRAVELQQHWLDSADCRIAYYAYVIDHQWSLEDAANLSKVSDFINQAVQQEPTSPQADTRRPRLASRTHKTINVVAVNKGWLFEDLKRHASSLQHPGFKVVPSDHPLLDADSWVFIRPHEAARSPDLSRTVIQIHDLFDEQHYEAGGDRHVVAEAGALVFTHPQQQELLQQNAITYQQRPFMCRPIGALSAFTMRQSMARKFTIGWVGRSIRADGRDLKRLHWLAKIDARLPLDKHSYRYRLIGESLHTTATDLRAGGAEVELFDRRDTPIKDYPKLYQDLDCLLITSSTEAGPMVLFEALASGIPVISTEVGWSPELIQHGSNGLRADSIAAMASAITQLYTERQLWFSRRQRIAATMGDHTLENWWQQCIELASTLADH